MVFNAGIEKAMLAFWCVALFCRLLNVIIIDVSNDIVQRGAKLELRVTVRANRYAASLANRLLT
jgi:hypothetical protein